MGLLRPICQLGYAVAFAGEDVERVIHVPNLCAKRQQMITWTCKGRSNAYSEMRIDVRVGCPLGFEDREPFSLSDGKAFNEWNSGNRVRANKQSGSCA